MAAFNDFSVAGKQVPSTLLSDEPFAVPLHSKEFEKCASEIVIPERIKIAIAHIKPRDDGVYLLVHGLGGAEYWGCFPPGSLVKREDGTEACIEDVQVGDAVITHKGRSRTVTKIYSRFHTGELLGLTLGGSLNTTWLTPNHPVLILRKDDLRCLQDKSKRCTPDIVGVGNLCQRGQGCERTEFPEPDLVWVPASEIQEGDFVCYVKQSGHSFIDKHDATLLGYYAAEGNIVWNREEIRQPRGLEFTFNIEETTYVESMRHICEAKGYAYNGPYPRTRDNTLRFHILNKNLAELALEHVGTLSREKCLSAAMMSLRGEPAKAFIGAWINGDGTQPSENNLAGDTSSYALARGVWHLCRQNGMGACLQRIPVQGYDDHYRVRMTAKESESLSEYCSKLSGYERKQIKSWTFEADHYRLIPVRSISHLGYSGTVHNLEVAEDNSYVVDGIAVHNSNHNGDAFPEYINGEPHLVKSAGDYGYGTFEKFAYPYREHKNHDPIHAIGEKIKFAAYSEPMHRVEVIVFINNDKAPDLVEKIARGEDVAWSMGTRVPYDLCQPAGALIATTDGYYPIETIEEGHEVFSAEGNAHPVTKLFRRMFTGDLVTLRAAGVAEAIQLTDKHPVHFVIGSQVRAYREKSHRFSRYTQKEICEAQQELEACIQYEESAKILPGDYIAVPRVKQVEGPGLSYDQAQLLGYYIGDGCLTRQRRGLKKDGAYRCMGVQVTSHADAVEHIARVSSVFERLTDKESKIYDSGAERNAKIVVISDVGLGEWVEEYCGGPGEKRVPREIFCSVSENKLAFIGGWVDTDGSVDLKKKSLRVSTVTREHALQLQLLFWSLGIPATANRCKVTGGYTSPSKDTFVYTICVSAGHSWKLAPYSLKCRDLKEVKRRGAEKSIVLDDYILFLISEAETEFVEELPVFNFEVETDHSYISGNIGLHNCSKCHNQAKNRSEYCEHLKFAMNQVHEDGTKNFAINPFMKFFDMSHVRRGADPQALTLRKIAREQTPLFNVPSPRMSILVPIDLEKDADSKEADIQKEVPLMAEKADKETVESASKVVPHDLESQKPHKAVIIILKKRKPIEHRLSDLLHSGIFPLKEELDEADISEDDIPKKMEHCPAPNMNAMKELTAALALRSMHGPYLTGRVLKRIKEGNIGPQTSTEQSPKLAALVENCFKSKSWADQYIENLAQPEILYTVIPEVLHEKHAAPYGLKHVAADFAIPALLAGLFRGKAERGQELNPLQGFVAKHPVMSGGLTALLHSRASKWADVLKRLLRR